MNEHPFQEVFLAWQQRRGAGKPVSEESALTSGPLPATLRALREGITAGHLHPFRPMHTAETERTRLAVQLEQLLERPMIALSALWIVLMILEFAQGESRLLVRLTYAIWAVFAADFALRLWIAPRKRKFLRRNWITALSLLLPAFRLLRIARFVRAARLARVVRGIRGAKLLGSINRGLRAARRVMRRRGVGFVAAATLIVLFTGAAGMMVFEREGSNAAAFASYGSSLWWTAMLLTSLGSEFWPRTAGGRLLTLMLGIYGFSVFGYLTATLASYFVDRDSATRNSLTAPRTDA